MSERVFGNYLRYYFDFKMDQLIDYVCIVLSSVTKVIHTSTGNHDKCSIHINYHIHAS